MQRRAAEVYAEHEGKHVDEVAAILGVTRYTVTRAARTYGVRFAGIDVRKVKTPHAAPPKPETRRVVVSMPHAPSGGHSMTISLPKEPWL